MGFMDKAKQLAEQAQQKLDETQKNFNKSNSPESQQGDGVKYDEHGRPIQDAPPAAAAAPPAAEPAAPAAPADPAAPAAPTEEQPAADAPAPPPPAPPAAGDANASPDPFKPIQ
jgi:hypothetical protein